MPTELVQDRVKDALAQAMDRASVRGDLSLSEFPTPTVELPKREEWGDFSSNVAMMLAPRVRRSPLEVAGLLAEELRAGSADLFARVDVAPPGFLNLTIKPGRWVEILQTIEELGAAYGTSSLGQGRRVLVEFVSANPTGPLHVGHGRGAALGQAIANLLEANGYGVEREYYINDAGRQLRLLGASIFARYQEHHGRSVSFPEDGYHGSYIRSLAEELARDKGSALLDVPVEEAETRCADFGCQRLLQKIQEDLGLFGIAFDSWYSESQLHTSGAIRDTLEHLKARQLVFEKEGAWWFKSSVFEDEKDRVVEKQGGDYTYLASDIAYHRDKLLRGYDELINVWGADHHGYIARMRAAVQAFGYPKDRLRVVLVQMVRLLRGGQEIAMSKRAGEFVTLREVVEEVGADAAKFFFLMRRSDTHLDFDLDLAKEQSSDNPVYYVQYAHARIASVFRVARSRGIGEVNLKDINPDILRNPDEIRLMKQLSCYPDTVNTSVRSLEPHRLTFYLQELAGCLHTYYNRHRVLPAGEGLPENDRAHSVAPTEERPLDGDLEARREAVTPEITMARLALLRQVQVVIRNGLGLLGISAPDQM